MVAGFYRSRYTVLFGMQSGTLTQTYSSDTLITLLLKSVQGILSCDCVWHGEVTKSYTAV